MKVRDVILQYDGETFSARPEPCGTGSGSLAVPAHWFLYDAADSCVAILRAASTSDTDEEVRAWSVEWLADRGPGPEGRPG
jgi:hypothetical protein